jgi:hypothetical protein
MIAHPIFHGAIEVTELRTAAELAYEFGVDKSTVTRDAAKHNIGRLLGNQLFFSPSEVKKMLRIRREKRNSGKTLRKTIA